ncbi:class I SAM-dependent methyltransferase [Amycolatopsis thermophila]|uniref:Ubiquinone/menaquinone biosynthesis C-methylase UbiE n=1 Tax=Amycolatopsis thermophila TaxID=206084 RepID=A0ABU0EWR7_9PSEU|nr:class I SAM-dependent methyltransferase [Amycolatopsis thermophila]MDQ0379755.1 ubiquinone/menaquinone biosynthesis C-methylase UbiE [Amycolatopsis thermophila]
MQNRFFAWLFARIGARNEARGNADLRRELLAGARGRVLEVGAGTGLNFPHYPPGVEVTAVEPEPTLRAHATKAAEGTHITVVEGLADDLPLSDASVDEVVVSGVLCSVPDPAAALAEFRRVLRPGGRLRFYEHVRARTGPRARWQDVAALVWPRLMGGCMPNRDTRAAIERAGFAVSHCRDLIFPPGARISVVAPRVLGVAVSQEHHQ